MLSRRSPCQRPPARRLQRGLSLVEMMVGVTIGLFVVAGAVTLVVTQLGENRKLLLETQVQQDLRATADIITRELRRSGFNNTPQTLVWSPKNGAAVDNAFAKFAVTEAGKNVGYSYQRGGSNSEFGFRWDSENKKIRQRVNTVEQDLTDSNILRVTNFSVVEQTVLDQQLVCPSLCPGNTQDCWPKLHLTDAVVTIEGEAVSDPSVKRVVVSRVRLRNDRVKSDVLSPQVCP